MGTYRNEYVRCGKPACRSCPHGPYWYEYFHERTAPCKWHLRKQYHGRKDPRENVPVDPEEAIWQESDETLALAYHICGVRQGMSKAEALRAYRVQKIRIDPTWPDAANKMARLEHAWAIVRRRHRWK
jgi:hypothetical protein